MIEFLQAQQALNEAAVNYNEAQETYLHNKKHEFPDAQLRKVRAHLNNTKTELQKAATHFHYECRRFTRKPSGR